MQKDRIYTITLIIIIIDQLIKIWIRKKMALLSTIPVIPHFFSITYVENKGAAWGILSDCTPLLIVASFVIFYCLLKYINEEKNWNNLKIWAFAFLLGGLIGNLLDRLFYHQVTDYLDFHLFGYHYPIFNLADTLIVLGVILLVIEMIKASRKEKQ